jgi:hypothetical protein
MNFVIEDGVLKEKVTVGSIIDASQKLENAQLELSKATARKNKATADEAKQLAIISALKPEAAKFDIPQDITDEEKIKLVATGIKVPKDFPGDDWLTKYVLGKNKV